MVAKLLWVLVISFSPFAQAGDCAADAEECAFYCEKAMELKCPPSNSFVRYGSFYCHRFLETQAMYSEFGRIYLPQIRACLIEAVASTEGLTCENAEHVIFRSHVDCYVENGFCRLPFADRWRILWTIKGEFWRPLLYGAIWQIEDRCRQREQVRFQSVLSQIR